MHKRKLLALLVAVAGSVAGVSVALSQDEKEPGSARADEAAAKADEAGAAAGAQAGPGGQPDMAAMMKKMTDAMTPGPMHKHLEPMVGKWNSSTKAWMGGPDSEPSVSTGTMESKWVLGGRYVQETHKSMFKMPGPDGQMQEYPFEGMGLTGYDNFKKMYTFSWADNMSTQILTGLGTYSADKKALTLYGTMDEAMLDTVGRTVKYVHRMVDKNTHVFEIYDLHAGEDYKMLEVTYERAK